MPTHYGEVREDDWRLIPYVAPSGHSPVLEFLDELHRTKPKWFLDFHNRVKPALVRRGPFVGGPMWDGLGGSLGEIRWGRCRVYCSTESDRRIVMYEGVVKRWRVFQNKHRRLCEQRRDDFLSVEYDEESRGYRYEVYCQRRAKNGLA